MTAASDARGSGPPPDLRPLVLTLALDPRAQARFDDLRRAHFPPERHHVGAHVTLFHALPGRGSSTVLELVAEAARRPAFDVAVTGVRLLGRGVAYTLASDDLDRLTTGLRRALLDAFGDEVTPQDRQRSAPHVTVQNKVTPERARALHAELSAGFARDRVGATGIAVWRYAGGPWEPLRTEPFRAGGAGEAEARRSPPGRGAIA